MALTFTQADLDRLKEAYLTGAREVQVGDRKIVYNSPKDILAAIQVVQEYIEGVSTDVDDNPSIIRPTFSRGES